MKKIFMLLLIAILIIPAFGQKRKIMADINKLVVTENITIPENVVLDLINISLPYSSQRKNDKYHKKESDLILATRIFTNLASTLTVDVSIKIIDKNCLIVCSNTKIESYIKLDNNDISLTQKAMNEFANSIKNEIEKEVEKQIFQNNLTKNIERIKSLGYPIIIKNYKTEYSNSAGGVPCRIEFQNISLKKIKYIYFTVVPYNAVNDIVSSEIGGKVVETLEFTGPLNENENRIGTWENVWYNHSIRYMKITNIEIIFMDNTRISIKNANVEKVLLNL